MADPDGRGARAARRSTTPAVYSLTSGSPSPKSFAAGAISLSRGRFRGLSPERPSEPHPYQHLGFTRSNLASLASRCLFCFSSQSLCGGDTSRAEPKRARPLSPAQLVWSPFPSSSRGPALLSTLAPPRVGRRGSHSLLCQYSILDACSAGGRAQPSRREVARTTVSSLSPANRTSGTPHFTLRV